MFRFIFNKKKTGKKELKKIEKEKKMEAKIEKRIEETKKRRMKALEMTKEEIEEYENNPRNKLIQEHFKKYCKPETEEEKKLRLTWKEYENIIKNMNEEQKIKFEKNGNELWDFVEDTEEYKKAMKEIEPVLEKEFPEDLIYMGRCHFYWKRKAELLKEAGIIWRSPSQMNPHIKYD